ncbi:coenzyme F420-0:L-glutamate ligase [Gammaproteobacteria bacterium]|jgi:coenzyme F420-0:L-glutamate ligase/coenzyme F420-1:gamma-L-glutamate ligase|nr:coenzyme F420-0:L-glutamate ligase [Gammaproteobacteria bacterium]|tara:strand:- start:1614 stop:2399 length:786 start_codon:yes stop_codon:yes gene_type:complete
MEFKSKPDSLSIFAIKGIPPIQSGDPIGEIIVNGMKRNNIILEDNDVIVIAQKIISKSENRLISLSKIKPTQEAMKIAKKANKDPRVVELILQESKSIIRVSDGVVIVEHRLGHVLANAGIDRSNIESDETDEKVLLLPEDPDASAEKIRSYISKKININIGVLITDSMGRAWRLGTTGHALGSSGIKTLIDLRNNAIDLFERELQTTCIAWADQLAAAATLIMGESNEGIPVVIIKGINTPSETDSIHDLIRPKNEDLFR